MPEVFTLDGKYTKSSDIPTIAVEGKEIARVDFWKQKIETATQALPAGKSGEQPSYIATGGGYASNSELVAYEKSSGAIASDIVSIKGDLFRDLPEFAAEKELVRAQIAAFLGEEKLKENPNAVEQTLSAFYSDEVNTKIAKEAVKASFPAHKSVIYESASIYPDTVERAIAAGQNGLKTVLIAGDKDLDTAIAALKDKVEPANIATSYQKFSARFESELVPLFDEVRLYNIDGAEPKLIAQKTGKGQPLEILDKELYQKFLDKRSIDPQTRKSATADTNIINDEHQKKEKENKKDDPTPKVPQAPPREAGGRGGWVR
jgi:hypothetical protein